MKGLFSKGGCFPYEIFFSREELLVEGNTSFDFNTQSYSPKVSTADSSHTHYSKCSYPKCVFVHLLLLAF